MREYADAAARRAHDNYALSAEQTEMRDRFLFAAPPTIFECVAELTFLRRVSRMAYGRARFGEVLKIVPGLSVRYHSLR